MPRSRLLSTAFPILILIVSMASIQTGASLAKSLFPVLGAEGVTSMRLVFAAILLLAILSCLLIFMWRIPVVDEKQPKH